MGLGLVFPSHPAIAPLSSATPRGRSRIPSPVSPIHLPLSIYSSRAIAPSSPPKSVSVAVPSVLPRAAWQQPKYVYPDPVPEFAVAETQKFRDELLKKLSKNKETFGDEIDAIVKICSEIFSDFLHNEYGGPGTLLVEPFTDMLVALKEKQLPGAPVAARAALLWAQNYVDKDWEIWTSQQLKRYEANEHDFG